MNDEDKLKRIQFEFIKQILLIEKEVVNSIVKEPNSKIVETIIKKFEEVLNRNEDKED